MNRAWTLALAPLPLLAALLAPAAMQASPAGDAEPPGPDTAGLAETPLDLSGLPLPDGYLAFRILLHEETDFALVEKGGNASAAGTAYQRASLFGAEGGSFGSSWGRGAAQDLASASVDGRGLRCCEAFGSSWTGGEGSTWGQLAPGAYWFVVLVADARSSDGTASLWTAPGAATVEPPLQGRSVDGVDLAAEARDAGTHVATQALAATPGGGKAERAWTPRGHGFLFLHASAHGGASADLEFGREGRAAERFRLDESFVSVRSLGAGSAAVRLSGLHEPLWTAAGGTRGSVEAVALFADLPIAADETEVHAHP